MAIQYVGGGLSANAGSTTVGITYGLTSLTGGIGSSPQEGDIIIAVVSSGSYAARTIGILTTGYTEIASLNADDSYNTNFSIAYKIMGSTPDTNITTTPSGHSDDAICLAVHVWRGVDITTPFDVTTTTATGIDTNKPTPPAITPVTSGSIILCAGGSVYDELSAHTYAASQLSNFITLGRNDTCDAVVGLGSYAWSSGTFTPTQWSFSYDATTYCWCACTLALRPLISGPANLKSYNTNLKANIKTINTNLIANIKTLNTNA